MKHGVYVNETATQVRKPRETTTGIQFIVGTAPIHKLENPAAAVNTPILINSMAEASAKLGYSEEFDKFTLCQSMYMDFSVLSVAPAIFVNVLDPSKVAHTSAFTNESVTLTDGVGKLDTKYVLIDSSLVVKNGDDVLVKGTDYEVEHDENEELVVTVITSGISTITVSGKALNPLGVTASDIIGGIDQVTGAESGLQLIRRVYPKFGINAATIITPGFSHNPSVAAVMASLCEEINGVFRAETVIDIDSSTYTGYTQAATMKSSIGIKSPHAYLVWPKVKIGSHVIYASANVAAVAQRTDYDNGSIPNMSVDNKSAWIDAAVLENGTEILLDSEQGNVLNAAGIGTYVKVQGSIKLWGSYSAAYPDSNDPKDIWWCIRRFLSWHENTFIRTYFDRIGGPLNRKLVESIVDAENIILNSYVSREICASAKISISDENTDETLAAGELYLTEEITPFQPLQAIINTVSYNAEALMAALSA